MEPARNLAAAATAVMVLLPACGDGASNEEAALEMSALGPQDHWEGRTLEEWAVEYMRWYYSPTACDGFPNGDPDGSACGDYQDPASRVFFMERSALGEGTPMRVDRTRCRVPFGKAIFVPVSSFGGDKAGMKDPMSDEEIERTVAGIKGTMREPLLKADGRDLSDNLEARAVGPLRFNYHVPPAPNRYGCDSRAMISDVDVDPSFVAGIYVMFRPPSVGRHELEYSSVLTFFDHDYSFYVRSAFEVMEQE